MNILFTICGRAGSKGVKNKNVKEMCGHPLVYYTLAAIKGYKDNHPDRNIYVALNTDSDLLAEIVRNQHYIEDVICVNRKESLAGDVVAKVEVIKDTYLSVKNSTKMEFDAIVDLDITSPMRRVADIEAAVDSLLGTPEYDLVFSVVKARRSPYFNMVEKKEDGMYRKICKSMYSTRQQTPQSYELNASIYAYRPGFLESNIDKTILDYNCGIVEMEDYLVLDIDSEDDFEMMQILYRYYSEKDESIVRC